MKGLFARTILSFAAALLVLLAVLAVVFVVGFGRSLEEWERQKTQEVERYAGAILDGRTPDGPPPLDTPLFVYDAGRALVWSNRGRGRNVPEAEMIPLADGGVPRGYYYTGGVRFGGDAANQRLLASLRNVVGLGSMLSAAVAFLFAFYFAARLSRPARSVAAGLDRISCGNLSEPIPEAGATEIVHIARAANRMQQQLAGEREIRQQWAQDVAHDLRTPIAAIKAQLEGMRDGVLPLDDAAHRADLRRGRAHGAPRVGPRRAHAPGVAGDAAGSRFDRRRPHARRLGGPVGEPGRGKAGAHREDAPAWRPLWPTTPSCAGRWRTFSRTPCGTPTPAASSGSRRTARSPGS